jgi:RHS repeat-associated protein
VVGLPVFTSDGKLGAMGYDNDVNLTDGASHQLGLYALDWDSLGRQERVEILDATTNAVLDTREVTSFSGGKHLVWELKGHVKLKVTNLGLAGTNAVLSGLFFEADTNAGFVTTDATAQGSWKGAHGGNGYDLPNDAASYPSYAQVSYTGMTSYTWSASTADVRAPLKAASTTDRAASCRYSYTSFTIDVNLTDGLSHQVALYALDWDSLGRQQRVEVLNATSNATLDTRDLGSFAGGKYLVWILKGHLKLKVTNLGPPGTNAVISGLFFDALQNSNAGKINWLVADQLGTPRMIFDQSGSLATVKRHDYLPFGEELFAGQGGRTTTQGYSAADGVRQKFTLKERDNETGLDYSINRYYSNLQGRFTSVDPLDESGEPPQPQSWNRYSYAINNPLKFMDPDGLRYVQRKDGNGDTVYGWCATDKCYEAALEGGWSAVQFNESKPFEYTTVGGGGGDRYSKYRLNPDGTNGYADVLDGNYRAMSTDWNAQLAIGGLLKGLASVLGGVMESLGSAITSQAAQATTQAGATTAEQQIVKAAAGKITGFTKHGINQAISRDGVGVSTRAIAEAVKNPIKVVVERGATKYIGRDATVVLNKAGKVITTWARNSAGKRGP